MTMFENSDLFHEAYHLYIQRTLVVDIFYLDMCLLSTG